MAVCCRHCSANKRRHETKTFANAAKNPRAASRDLSAQHDAHHLATRPVLASLSPATGDLVMRSQRPSPLRAISRSSWSTDPSRCTAPSPLRFTGSPLRSSIMKSAPCPSVSPTHLKMICRGAPCSSRRASVSLLKRVLTRQLDRYAGNAIERDKVVSVSTSRGLLDTSLTNLANQLSLSLFCDERL